MDYDILPPTDDWTFKLLFGDERNKSILIDLLKSFVELPKEEYDLIFLDTDLKPEAEDDKLGIVDVKIRTKTGKVINVEIQMNPFRNIGKRLSFYKSKLIVEQIAKSEHYSVIQKVICFCITGYELFSGVKEYLNCFRFINPKNSLCFEDIPEEILTLELPKVPAKSDGTSGWLWTQFLRSRTKEEFEMVAVQNPEIRKATDTLYEISADKEARALYEHRLKMRLDENTRIHEAREDGLEIGRQDGAKALFDLIKSGKTPEEAMAILGLV